MKSVKVPPISIPRSSSLAVIVLVLLLTKILFNYAGAPDSNR
jgi:hypothetical protein